VDRILESSLKENVCIDGMDLQIMPRKGRTDTRFVVRQLREASGKKEGTDLCIQ